MPTQTERKVIRLGRGTLIITIPKAWADYYEITPGDQVRVVADHVLVVHPPRRDDVDREIDSRYSEQIRMTKISLVYSQRL